MPWSVKGWPRAHKPLGSGLGCQSKAAYRRGAPGNCSGQGRLPGDGGGIWILKSKGN